MMHQKALLFGDHEIASKIIQETSPDKTQALGRKVKISIGALSSVQTR
jgi:predicted NAD-dependent protein-ADP-ribosyltransferase YbiA (DUF1768 family)